MTPPTTFKLYRRHRPDLIKEEFRQGVPLVYPPCPVCGHAMPVSEGQIKACHKECKPEFKRLLKLARRMNNEAPYARTVEEETQEANP